MHFNCTWISTCTMHMNRLMYINLYTCNVHELLQVLCTWIDICTMYNVHEVYWLVNCVFWLTRKVCKPESSFAIAGKFEQVCSRIILGE